MMEVDRWWSGGHTEEDQWLRWFNGMVWRRFGDGDLAMATWRSVQERNGARVILFGVRVFFFSHNLAYVFGVRVFVWSRVPD